MKKKWSIFIAFVLAVAAAFTLFTACRGEETVTVSFETGEEQTVASVTRTPNSYYGELPAPASVREYYGFAGWYATNDEGEEEEITAQSIVPFHDVTLRARWSYRREIGSKPAVVSAGGVATAVIDEEGNLWYWGTSIYDYDTSINRDIYEYGVKFTTVSAGYDYFLALDDEGNYWAWGSNGGNLGDGTTMYSTETKIPHIVDCKVKFATVTAGYYHSLGIDEDGNLWAWGSNGYGQLGDGGKGTQTVPVRIKQNAKFTQISAGKEHSLGIDEDGNLWTWGSNVYGQLGDGGGKNQITPVQIMQNEKFTQISAGKYHSLALDEGGNLWAWGKNDCGKLGDGSTKEQTTPVRIMQGTRFTQISAGDDHSLALDEDGNLWAWGSNFYGQLGDGGGKSQSTPVQIMRGTLFTQISAGGKHSVAVSAAGDLYAWGDNTNSQIGAADANYKTLPVRVMEEQRFLSVSCSREYSLAVDDGGNVWVFGKEPTGALSNYGAPKKIEAEGVKFTKVAAGDDHSLALDEAGNLWAWGKNDCGQLGDGSGKAQTAPVQITQNIKFKQIDAGEKHSLALDENGGLWSWGVGGMVGDATMQQRNTPVQVIKSATFRQIATRGNHCVALSANGGLWVWGKKSSALGDNSPDLSNDPDYYKEYLVNPKLVAKEARFTAIASNFGAGAALDEDGNLWGWGQGWTIESQNGTETMAIPVPTKLETGYQFTKIMAMAGCSCVFLETKEQDGAAGAYRVMGNNKLGIYGNGKGSDWLKPYQLIQLTLQGKQFVTMAAGNSHALAIDGEGRLWAWGGNQYGQLGTGNRFRYVFPAQVALQTVVEKDPAGAGNNN